MNLQKISGITFLLLLVSNTAFAGTVSSPLKYDNVLAQSASVSLDTMLIPNKWLENTKNKLTVLEELLTANDPKDIYKNTGFTDLREGIISPKPTADFRSNPEYPALKSKLFELRQEYNKRGVNTGSWKDWTYDGQTVTDKDKKNINNIENLVNDVISSTSYSAKVDDKINEITKILSSTEYDVNPVLNYYKENVGMDLLQGAKFKNNLNRITQIAREYRGLAGRIKIKNKIYPRDIQFAEKLLKEIDDVKNSGFALKDFKFKLNEKDPLSQEITLEQVRNLLINI